MPKIFNKYENSVVIPISNVEEISYCAEYIVHKESENTVLYLEFIIENPEEAKKIDPYLELIEIRMSEVAAVVHDQAKLDSQTTKGRSQRSCS